ncbi:NADH dehydrogenase [ubiquinone] 1 alpha subcomplex assembly factor 3-like [Branchiostoma floridae]|uniref:NADH dehydrogenase [ubiquinone] 1 alpha subcomplex assembly factor 3 n=1 Tax=Branchiostoma floridae TaxID=7739 RepID=A0A9J7MQX2_BRAFL|nr:NADH dehydrogenase [ubiquinone] 1 alpha subcomplex assembly factor 3-like [Branchiostoma floridae]
MAAPGMLARATCSAFGRLRPVFRQPRRWHRLTPTDDELYVRTTISLLEKQNPQDMFISNYSERGFTIRGDKVLGPVAIVPRSILSWDVAGPEDINKESLALFYIFEPKIEIVVLGVGNEHIKLDPELHKFMRQKGIALEVQDTAHACATFNYLVSEGRVAGAALIPPTGGVKEGLLVQR